MRLRPSQLPRRLLEVRCTFPDCGFVDSPERGVDELAGAYERGGLTLEEFEGDRYIRLGRLKRLLDNGSLDDSLRWHADFERERALQATGRPASSLAPRTADATMRAPQ